MSTIEAAGLSVAIVGQHTKAIRTEFGVPEQEASP